MARSSNKKARKDRSSTFGLRIAMRDVKFSCMHARIYEILQIESCIGISTLIWIERMRPMRIMRMRAWRQGTFKIALKEYLQLQLLLLVVKVFF